MNLSDKTSSRNIQLVDFPDVDEIDAATIKKIINESYDKISMILNNKISLKLHFKQYSKKGLRRKHSIHAKLDSPSINLTASDWDWKLITALQKTLEALVKEIKSKLK